MAWSSLALSTMTWFFQSEKSTHFIQDDLHLVPCMSQQAYCYVQECREAVVNKMHIPLKPVDVLKQPAGSLASAV